MCMNKMKLNRYCHFIYENIDFIFILTKLYLKQYQMIKGLYVTHMKIQEFHVVLAI